MFVLAATTSALDVAFAVVVADAVVVVADAVVVVVAVVVQPGVVARGDVEGCRGGIASQRLERGDRLFKQNVCVCHLAAARTKKSTQFAFLFV